VQAGISNVSSTIQNPKRGFEDFELAVGVGAQQ
jgi:hypothetical protein